MAHKWKLVKQRKQHNLYEPEIRKNIPAVVFRKERMNVYVKKKD